MEGLTWSSNPSVDLKIIENQVRVCIRCVARIIAYMLVASFFISAFECTALGQHAAVVLG